MKLGEMQPGELARTTENCIGNVWLRLSSGPKKVWINLSEYFFFFLIEGSKESPDWLDYPVELLDRDEVVYLEQD